MNASKFLVTGGTGSLGSRVVNRLRDAGREVRALSRSGRSGTVRGDLLTGEGLKEAVEGVDVIVHCASSPTKTRRTDVEGTERLLKTAEQAGVSNFVFISIVGVDRNPYYPYYRMKLEVERIIEQSAVPYTILRATQFHEFVLRMIQFLDRLPVMIMPKGFLLQPIDIGEVADRLVEIALSEPAERASDIGGPETKTAAEFARVYFKASGRTRKVVEVPLPGKMARAWRQGAQLAPDHKFGRTTWEEFLGQTLRSSNTDETTRKELT
jgi:uncharacterized protein YbjT (DUF2867 family)